MTDFTMTFLVAETPDEVFNAINNVRGWWSETVNGGTSELNDEFTYRYKDFHYSKQRLVEVVENKKVAWEVVESNLSFVHDTDLWTGTKISFDLSTQDGQTKVLFTHFGLNPEVECFDACSKGWTHYLQNSLIPLITTGKGNPDKKETKLETAGTTI